MTLPVVVAAAAVLLYLAYRFLYGTDTPHIKGLPEVPGLPLFGSLFELGTNHATVAQGWAEKYGPVFQVRLGNRVSASCLLNPMIFIYTYIYIWDCKPIYTHIHTY